MSSNHVTHTQGSFFVLNVRSFLKDSNKPMPNFPSDPDNIKFFLLLDDDSGVAEFTGSGEIKNIDSAAASCEVHVTGAKSGTLSVDERMDGELEANISGEPNIVCFAEILTIKARLKDR